MAGGTMAMTYDRLLAGTTLGAKISLSPNSFRQSFSSIAANRQTETLTSTQFMSTTASRLVAEMGHLLPLRGFVSARFASSLTGASFSERRSTSSVTMSLRDNSEAASVHAAWYLTDAVSLGVGLRREWREAPLRTSGADAATVGNVSGSWRLAPRVTLRGAVASSHRWPTLNELVRNFQAGAVLTRANPNLLPERAVSGEVAATISHKWWQASVGGFWTVVKDAIANVTIQSTPTIIRERRNAGEAHAQGLEVDLDAMPVSWLTLRGSFLVVDSRFRHSLEAPLEGKWLPQVPHVSGSISGDIRILERAHASFAWRTISTQFDDDRNTFLLDDAKQLDLRLRFGYRRVGGDLTIENATDARIEVGRTPLVTIAPGRTVRVSVSWRFTRQ
jgi:outer membrane receptor protein involved in Fe transport